MIAGRGRNSGNSSVQCSCSPKDNDGQNPETELSVIRQSHHHYAINSWLFITRLNTFLNIHLIITAKHSEKTSEQKHPKGVDNNWDKSHMYYYNYSKYVKLCWVCMCVPPHSCRTLSSESTVEGDRSGRLSTISYALGYLWCPLFYRGEHGNRPPYPHLPQLKPDSHITILENDILPTFITKWTETL